MAHLIDTNVIYRSIEEKQEDKGRIAHLLSLGDLCVSRVSILEWVLRNAHPLYGEINKLKKGLKFIKDNNIEKIDNRFISIDDSEISHFLGIDELKSDDSVYGNILSRRIDVEQEWLSFSLMILLGAYVSHMGSELIGNEPEKAPIVSEYSLSILGEI